MAPSRVIISWSLCPLDSRFLEPVGSLLVFIDFFEDDLFIRRRGHQFLLLPFTYR